MTGHNEYIKYVQLKISNIGLKFDSLIVFFLFFSLLLSNPVTFLPKGLSNVFEIIHGVLTHQKIKVEVFL
jgi:hypothetical protein